MRHSSSEEVSIPMHHSFETRVLDLSTSLGYRIGGHVTLKARDASYLGIPSPLNPKVFAHLNQKLGKRVYSHQNAAISELLEGNDICVATPVASGKSLIFMAFAAHIVLSHPHSRVLALYPAKALIQDQLNKWKEITQPLGIKYGFIDGSISTSERSSVISSNDIILATPDVVHAWLLPNNADRPVNEFLSHLRLLVLDEAHVYDGVFGTNMAFLIRRLSALSGRFQIASCTATIGDPSGFVSQLTGRQPRTLSEGQSGAPFSQREIFELTPIEGGDFERKAELLKRLAQGGLGKFIAFADSRKMVEKLVAATRRPPETEIPPARSDGGEVLANNFSDEGIRVMPYRSGYDEEDRIQIQKSLMDGTLVGVVATSALELGIDIGDIATTVLFGRPRSPNSLWQRIGRSGRSSIGLTLLVNDTAIGGDSLESYINRPIVPNRLYLRNRYIQYSQALCAATEIAAIERENGNPAFESLPGEFVEMLRNELNQTEAVPEDLYPLKQRAQAGPQIVFPLRAAGEPSFSIEASSFQNLGSITFGQAIRESYPGAIYYHMARPYRVESIHFGKQTIYCTPSKHYSTSPLLQSKVFPRFSSGVLQLRRSDSGFLIESEMQVSERVLGFTERRGSSTYPHSYDHHSVYCRKPLMRMFETTGICWWFEDGAGTEELTAHYLLEAFAKDHSIHSRDLGIGKFYSKVSPLGPHVCENICIYDSTYGSLRLTMTLAQRFEDTVHSALEIAKAGGEYSVVGDLLRLSDNLQNLRWENAVEHLADLPELEETELAVVAPGQRALFAASSGQLEEVQVIAVRYTPQGLVYDLEPTLKGTKWMASKRAVSPIPGESKMAKFNTLSGEFSDLS